MLGLQRKENNLYPDRSHHLVEGQTYKQANMTQHSQHCATNVGEGKRVKRVQRKDL